MRSGDHGVETSYERDEFAIPFLPVESYMVSVRAEGFKTQE